ncbi:MAG: 16S rRNA (guanine(527)-N(7))-methyltransferase RsmG, partial [Nitrosomonas sp.]|nr:16S rRNA (guanine(527)-N(7))-methyltransferase RsmG [Nitrosomonas sp.]
KLLNYLKLIQKWNGVHNLTAIRDPKIMLTHHIIDSVAVLPHITGTTIADIGSGAGLPGIPIAIMQPESAVTLIESNKKKSAFLQQAKIELKLTNITVIADRVEHHQTKNPFDIIISRALSNLSDFINMSAKLGDNETKKTQFVAMKANNYEQEIDNLPDGYRVDRIVPLNVPGLNAERHLIIIKQS